VTIREGGGATLSPNNTRERKGVKQVSQKKLKPFLKLLLDRKKFLPVSPNAK